MAKQSLTFVHIENIYANCLCLPGRPGYSEIEPITVALCISIRSKIHIKVGIACLNNHVQVSRFEQRVKLVFFAKVFLIFLHAFFTLQRIGYHLFLVLFKEF